MHSSIATAVTSATTATPASGDSIASGASRRSNSQPITALKVANSGVPAPRASGDVAEPAEALLHLVLRAGLLHPRHFTLHDVDDELVDGRVARQIRAS